MRHIANIFHVGGSQAVRLPAAFRFDAAEVYIRRDERTGDVILSHRPPDWAQLMASIEQAKAECGKFMLDRVDPPPQERKLL